ncbi:MAG: ATP synthase F1 subunit gamma [Nitrospiria bacterium]
MGVTLRELKGRIRSAKKTQQITKTMQMVAASRLKKSEETFRRAKPYHERMEVVLSHLMASSGEVAHPFFEIRDVKTIGLVVVTSDRGLCGAYNSSIIARAEDFLKELRSQEVKLILIGKKGHDYFQKREWPILFSVLDLGGRPDYQKISGITDQLVEAYLSGQLDEVHVLHTNFISAMSSKPVLKKFLNVKQEAGSEERNAIPEFILEPDFEAIIDQFLSRQITSRMYSALLESFTAENSSRMVAMKNATDSANEMIDHLSLMGNKARQAAITKEILEIVTAGEAMKA